MTRKHTVLAGLIALVISALAAAPVHAGPVVFAADVGLSTSPVEPGFTQMDTAVATNGTVTATASGTDTLHFRDRNPTFAPGYNEGALTRDLFFSNNLVTLAIEGLAPNREHFVTFWSFDTGELSNRFSHWYFDEVIAANRFATSYVTNPPLPTKDGQSTITTTFYSDSAGEAVFFIQSAGGSNAIVLNAFEIIVPEPASLTLLGLGALVLVRRRSTRRGHSQI